jgi:hypothetical protein
MTESYGMITAENPRGDRTRVCTRQDQQRVLETRGVSGSEELLGVGGVAAGCASGVSSTPSSDRISVLAFRRWAVAVAV